MKQKLKIVLAHNEEQIKDVYSMAQDFHEESHSSHGVFSPKKYEKFANFIRKYPDNYGAFIVYSHEEPVGFIYAVIGEGIISDNVSIATVQFLYVKKEIRNSLLGGKVSVSLIRNLIKWSKGKGAKEIMLHFTAGISIQKSNKFMNKLGFKTLGANYSMSIN
ncbi:GNAT family N-acetyltransferase [Kiloniella litopenaei]|uniref:GNAT family N-acetyltransferase n=1 Tax=Kiloniella litopenaei TaxID=1549748 RepID=UPI003BAD51B8